MAAATLVFALAGAARAADLPGATTLSGKAARALVGSRLSSLGAYAFDASGAPVEIPFQVDERTEKNRWVLDHGPKAGGDEEPGVFDRNDAIVFLNRDLGLRGDPSRLPDADALWLELRVGSGRSPLGFAYLRSLPAVSPKSVTKPGHARYDPVSDAVHAERYALHFDAILPTHVAFVDALGESGESFVSATHAHGEARLLGGVFMFRRTDADIEERIDGHRNGPVRALRRGHYQVPLPLGFEAAGRVDFLFYRDFLEITGKLKIKFPPWLLRADGEMTGYVELPRGTGARAVFDEAELHEPAEKKDGPRPDPGRWAALTLRDGRTLLLVVRLGGALRKMRPRFYFEDRPGGGPIFGFELSEASRLETGVHPFAVIAAFLRSPTEQQLLEQARLFLSPPPVSLSRLSRAVTLPGKSPPQAPPTAPSP